MGLRGNEKEAACFTQFASVLYGEGGKGREGERSREEKHSRLDRRKAAVTLGHASVSGESNGADGEGLGASECERERKEGRKADRRPWEAG